MTIVIRLVHSDQKPSDERKQIDRKNRVLRQQEVGGHDPHGQEREPQPMQDGRKQAVSLRLSAGDIRKIKKLAKRLGVRDSDVIRYALKVMLAKLAPLCDASVRGRNLMPVFVDTGVDILQHFELDEERLEAVINGGVEDEHRVDADDIQLMAMIGMQRNYAKLSLRDLHDKVAAPPASNALDDTLSTNFRRHLYAKYVQREQPTQAGDHDRRKKSAS